MLINSEERCMTFIVAGYLEFEYNCINTKPSITINMNIVTSKSTDGIEYKGLLTEAVNAKGIIIHIHGMSGSVVLNNYYQTMHDKYSEAGWSFLVGEHRGTGSITQFNSDRGTLNLGNTFEIFEECIYDIQGWINFAKDLGYKRIWLQAHSLGPSKVAYYMHQSKTTEVEGLVWISPSDMIGLVHDPVGVVDHNELLPEAEELVRQGKPQQILTNYLWDKLMLSAETYLNFFGQGAKDSIFNYGDSSLGWEVVNSINVPVLAITGTKDDGIVPVMDAYKAMQLLDSQLVNSPRKKTIVYKDAEHSFDGFGDQIVKDVLDFINS